jgi:hypothetical protein
MVASCEHGNKYFGSHTRRRTDCLVARLLASEERLSSFLCVQLHWRDNVSYSLQDINSCSLSCDDDDHHLLHDHIKKKKVSEEIRKISHFKSQKVSFPPCYLRA